MYGNREGSAAIGGACGCSLDNWEGSVPAAEEGEEDVAMGREREKQQLALRREVT